MRIGVAPTKAVSMALSARECVPMDNAPRRVPGVFFMREKSPPFPIWSRTPCSVPRVPWAGGWTAGEGAPHSSPWSTPVTLAEDTPAALGMPPWRPGLRLPGELPPAFRRPPGCWLPWKQGHAEVPTP